MSLPIIVVHGGAGDIPDSRVEAKLIGMRKALNDAYDRYAKTKDILEATIAAIEYMECDEAFNAGYGSVLTLEGEIELEALVVDGANLKAGAVTGLKNVLHPIQVARLVMDKTPHVILSGEGAQQFADQWKIPKSASLHTEAAISYLNKFKANTINIGVTEIGSTVGAIGLDVNTGHLVSCTSTGGMTGKMKGRVGDTPLPGCGGAADDNIGTVSTTGNGDAILRYNLAQRILLLLESGLSAQEATVNALEGMKNRIGGTAGAITLSKSGDVGIGHTSKRMGWAYQKNGKIYFGIDHNDKFEEDFQHNS